MPTSGPSATARMRLVCGSRRIGRREASNFIALTPLISIPRPSRASGETSLYDFTVTQYGKPYPLDRFRGKAVLVLNVASE